MASLTTQFNQGPKGFVFSNNPVVVEVFPSNIPSDAIFSQIIVDVLAEMNAQEKILQFAISIENNQDKVLIDVSSAIRSLMLSYIYDAEKVNDGAVVKYPYATFNISAWERYMANGILVNNNPVSLNYNVAYLGGISDYEIWEAGENNYPIGETVKFSTKPDGEMFHLGQLRSVSSFVPGTESNPGYVKTAFSTVTEGNIDHRKRETFLFVNSRGVFETISVITRESKKYELESEIMAKGNTPSYVPRPSLTTHKTLGAATWNMSSGYVNREWVEWFTTEFLTAKHYWMLLDGRWLPVTVTPEGDSNVIYDLNDPALKEVQFVVNSAIKGRIG